MIASAHPLLVGHSAQAFIRGAAAGFLAAILAACADSTTPEQVTDGPLWDTSQDQIFFVSTRAAVAVGADGQDIYRMNADGTDVVNVSNNPSADPSTHDDVLAGWSPDGRVVMQSTRDGSDRLYIVAADGSGCQALFADGYIMPFWSPDQTKVAAVKDWDVFVMNADGSVPLNLSNSSGFESWSTADPWSPDGSRVAHRSRVSGDWELYVQNADGSGRVNVTTTPGDETFLGWSPEGTRVLFESSRTGDSEIYVQGVDGSAAVNLTDDATGDDTRAIWVPKW